MSTVELYDPDIWPLASGEEPSSEHFEAIRRHIWLLENPCAGNLDTTILYGKWVGDASNFEYVEYNIHNWKGWNPGTDYHYGSPIVKYRWGPGTDEVDIFVFFADDTPGDKLDGQPPIIGGQLNKNYWLLSVDPNKYAHFNKNAGRPDIGADARWIVSQHGYKAPPDGPGWMYGYWEAWRELPTHTDPFEQIPHIKQAGIDEARHSPVEQRRNQITQDIRPVMERTYQNGYVGIVPNHTWWVHHDEQEKVSEYVYKSGEPVGSSQIGPSYKDPKYNRAFQDRALHCIEKNYGYLRAVDTEWKQTFNYWSTWGQNLDPDHDGGCPNIENYAQTYRGSFTVGQNYDKGEIVYHNLYWWRCIQDLKNAQASEAPGEPGGADYWAKPRHQPDYISGDPIYVQFASYLFNCNSSAFEKVLKDIGHYDWYWDDRGKGGFPEDPWWLYQKHYYWMTMHKSDPNAGHNITAMKRYPLPSGCWRRVWRHTMCWDDDRDVGQKARLGKIIDIDGEKVSMMWPGDLGPPPGYDEIENYTGELDGYHYNYRLKALIITRENYDNMDPDYKQYFIPEDRLPVSGKSIEQVFRDSYRTRKNSIESRLKARHDPLATEWWQDPETSELKEFPVFEIKADLVNDIKAALEQLTLLRQENTVSEQSYISSAQDGEFSTALAAYDAGIAECEAETNVTATASFYGDVGYVGLVRYDPAPSAHYSPKGSVSINYQTEKAWVEVTVTKAAGICFPATSVGTLIFDILASAYGADVPCSIGVPGVFSFKPPALDNKWYRAYIGQIPMSCEWEHDGAGDLPTDWNLKCKFRIVPAEDWPDKALFNFDGPSDYPGGGGVDRYVQTSVDVTTGSNVGMAWQINLDGFDDSVFEQDRTNYIEV